MFLRCPSICTYICACVCSLGGILQPACCRLPVLYYSHYKWAERPTVQWQNAELCVCVSGRDVKCPDAREIIYTIKERQYFEHIEKAYNYASKLLLDLLIQERNLMARLRFVGRRFSVDFTQYSWFNAHETVHSPWIILCWTEVMTDYKHTHTHPFNGPLSGTTQVSRYQKGKTNLDFTEARDSEWQWHQLGHICKSAPCSRQITTQHPTTQFFTGRVPFLPPNQQCQSTDRLQTRKQTALNQWSRSNRSFYQ